jgi:transposase
MSENNLLALDLAKSSFQAHVASPQGQVIARKKLTRSNLVQFVANANADVVAMEACAGANYWGRRFLELGKEVRLLAPQYVAPFVKTNKNDANDAEAIAEAASRASMRFVPIKSVAQQDISSLHCIRSRLVANRTALTNQIRGLMAEYGVVVAQGHAKLRALLATLHSGGERLGDLSAFMVRKLNELALELKSLDERIQAADDEVQELCDQDQMCRELTKIVGIGPLTATALRAVSGDMKQFKNGRQFAAFLGLVPRQNSTGGKTRLQGISKRGDTYVRTLLIHGARAAMITSEKRHDYRSRWVTQLKATKGVNRAAVALANRNARTVYAILRHGRHFDSARPEAQQSAPRNAPLQEASLG